MVFFLFLFLVLGLQNLSKLHGTHSVAHTLLKQLTSEILLHTLVLIIFFQNRPISAQKKKFKTMQEGAYFALHRVLSDRLTHLIAHHTSVNPGSWQLLIEAEKQVLAECVAHAVKLGEDEAFPENLPDLRIPDGHKRCNGPCKRVLPATDEWFQRDSSKKTGLRGRCKLCLSTKSVKKREREEERAGVGLNDVLAAAWAVENEEGRDQGARLETPYNGEVVAPVFVFNGRPKTIAKEVTNAGEDADLDAGYVNNVNGGQHTSLDAGNMNNVINNGRVYSLDVDGFEVIRSSFVVSEDELEALKRHAMTMVPETDVIFNNAAADDEANDKRRSQVEFKRFIGTDVIMARLHARMNEKLLEMYPSLTPNDMVILRSDPGCEDQRSHTDYTWQDWKRRQQGRQAKRQKSSNKVVASDDTPLTCVAAVMPNTFFDLWPGAIDCFDGAKDGRVFSHLRLVLNPGYLLIFRGDLVHAGAGFESFNIRVHTYLDALGVRRTKDTTFYMDAEAGCDYILPRAKAD